MHRRAVDAGHAELATLRLLALEGALAGETKVSCAGVAEGLDASSQTASRRLQALEDAGLLTREQAGDGQWVALTDAGERALEREYEQYRRLFEEPTGVELTGAVTGGMGEGRHYISLPGYREQFVERLGYEPFPGTLNVALDDASQRRRGALETVEGVPIDEWEDEDRTYGAATCYHATVTAGSTDGTDGATGPDDGDGATGPNGGAGSDDGTGGAGSDGGDGAYTRAHVIVPDRTHHDADQLEVIAPVKLRDELGLADDDPVTVRVEEH